MDILALGGYRRNDRPPDRVLIWYCYRTFESWDNDSAYYGDPADDRRFVPAILCYEERVLPGALPGQTCLFQVKVYIPKVEPLNSPEASNLGEDL